VEVLLVRRMRGGVLQAIGHECAKGDRLALHHDRYVSRRHLGPGEMEGQASLPEVDAAIAGKVKVEGVFNGF
jgi:hypothetical protein